jgi:hypothetical protein
MKPKVIRESEIASFEGNTAGNLHRDIIKDEPSNPDPTETIDLISSLC